MINTRYEKCGRFYTAETAGLGQLSGLPASGSGGLEMINTASVTG
jgi:hypothetical protein